MGNRYARRGHHEGNHAELAQVFKDFGCTVAATSAAGFGFPDIVLGCVSVTSLIDVKADGWLSASQERFIRDWRGGQIVVVSDAEDCIRRVRAIRRAARG